jgi:hypothetical protein
MRTTTVKPRPSRVQRTLAIAALRRLTSSSFNAKKNRSIESRTTTRTPSATHAVTEASTTEKMP